MGGQLQRLGFFTYLGGTRDMRRVLVETLELLCAAEELGFDSVWVAQHHFGPTVGRLPSPLPFLSAVAARTQRIHVGTAVVILPIEHPIRLAEDAAVVDLLSGGRLELGLGSGTDPAVFDALGYDKEQRRTLMRDGLDTLLSSLRGRPLPGGQIVQPIAAGLDRRVWQGVFSPERAREAAAMGTHVLLPKASPIDPALTPEQHVRAASAFFETWSRSWPGRLALSRPVYPARDRESAFRDLAAELEFLVGQSNSHPGHRLTVQDYVDSGVFHMGSVDDVVASLSADPALACATDLICQFGHIGPGVDNSLRALERIATEVAPALGWRPNRDQ